MGRLEPLTVAALGRSPYDDEYLVVYEGEGQQYDERGHPFNPTSRQNIKNFVRASNEVLQAAGIIEESSEAKERDKAYDRSLAEENESGIRMSEFGRILLVTGVWGVIGLRRRVLLYRSYAAVPFVRILQHEKNHMLLGQRLFAGGTSMIVSQFLKWSEVVVRYLIAKSRDGTSIEQLNQKMKLQRGWFEIDSIVVLQAACNVGITYISAHFALFAVLQQLDLLDPSQTFPNVESFVPFSRTSPLQLPPRPSSYTMRPLMNWAVGLILNTAPLAIVYGYAQAQTTLAFSLYPPIYSWLPKSRNNTGGLTGGFVDQDDAPANAPDRNEQSSSQMLQDSDDTALVNVDRALRFGDTVETAPPDSVLMEPPSQHTSTLRALEGQSPADGTGWPAAAANMSDEEEEEDEVAQTAVINFDVDTAEMTEQYGTWSAELRGVEETNGDQSETIYHLTALTLLPPLLATEGLCKLATTIVLLPLESVMVRTIARTFRRQAGLGVDDLHNLAFGGSRMMAQGLLNLFTVHILDLAVTTVLWGGIVVVFKNFRLGEKGEESEEADKENRHVR